jgi:CTP synthase
VQSKKDNTDCKFIFITGGVMSGLGKGVITASVAKLLQLCGYNVSCVKIDPYINYDAGTMNPTAHGEVFVTEDGGECDMDLGTYERFLDISISKEHNITTGRIYSDVIQAERGGKYLGQCVQIIPHITDNIKERLRQISRESNLDILVVECGGTVGDIESLPFLEALRQLELEVGDSNTLVIHVTLAPVLDVVGEQKTKPTQHSVQELRRIGIQPDILAVRCTSPLTSEVRHKISLFASVPEQNVISCHDAPSIYNVPEMLQEQHIVNAIGNKILLNRSLPLWGDWKSVTRGFYNHEGTVAIAIVGKYVSLPDSYVSVYHALSHSAAQIRKKLQVEWIESEKFEQTDKPHSIEYLNKFDGIVVPGGFGKRGSEGIIRTADYARISNIPYLGICFGFQLALVAFARHACGISDAGSVEVDPKARHPVVEFMPEQRETLKLGGSMRLGSHKINIRDSTMAESIYRTDTIYGRHRHRYELNRRYIDVLEKGGLVLSGFSDGDKRTEILEIPKHKFYFATQYHSEFGSRLGKPERSFLAFVESASAKA